MFTSPLKKMNITEKLEENGFNLYALDRSKREILFLFRNDRAIPFLDTGFVTASIFITRQNPNGEKELLVISEYDKKDLTVPAGSVDGGEMALDGVIREAEEEVGIKLDPSQIYLFSVRNRTFKETGKNHVDFNFCTHIPFDTKIKIDEKEVLNYKWIPLSKIKNKTAEAFDKKFSPLYADVIIDDEKLENNVKKISNAHHVVKIKEELCS